MLLNNFIKTGDDSKKQQQPATENCKDIQIKIKKKTKKKNRKIAQELIAGCLHGRRFDFMEICCCCCYCCYYFYWFIVHMAVVLIII